MKARERAKKRIQSQYGSSFWDDSDWIGWAIIAVAAVGSALVIIMLGWE
jgi:hypothetical protein